MMIHMPNYVASSNANGLETTLPDSLIILHPLKLSMVDNYSPKKRWLNGPKWSGIRQARSSVSRWETGAPLDLLKYVGAKSVARPDNFVSGLIW